MKCQKIDLRMNHEMAEDVCNFYKTNNLAKALRQCIRDAFLKHALHTKRLRQWSPEKTLELTMHDEFPKDTRASVYMQGEVLKFLHTYYSAKAHITNAAIIRCCIYDVLNSVVTSWILRPFDSVCYMIGQKNPKMQAVINSCFTDIRNAYQIDGYIEPFTGTANVLLHATESNTEIINDNSLDLVNLLRTIRDHPYEFKAELLCLTIGKPTFDHLKMELQNAFPSKASKRQQIQRAVACFYCRYSSHYGDCESYREIPPTSYMRKLDTIYALSNRLQGTDIKKSDALYFTKLLAGKTENYLIYLDAPYICSEEYYKRNNSKRKVFSSHIALRNRVQELRKRHICVLSYRITASESMKKKGITTEMLQRKLDTLYMNRGFHYRLKHFNASKGQIEILIATVPFTGSHPYIKSLTETGVR